MLKSEAMLIVVVCAACGGGGSEINAEGLACQAHGDCGSGWVCSAEKRCQKAYDGVHGVSAEQLVIGNSAGTVTGNATDASDAVVNGIRAAFDHVNRQGGVQGRQLVLEQRDDGYDPQKATSNVKAMTDGSSRQVFALLGNYGSAPVEAALETVLRNRTVLFGAITGASVLRKMPPDRYVFNYRAGAEEQAGLAVRYLTTDGDLGLHPNNIGVFAQAEDNQAQDRCTWNDLGSKTCDADDDAIGRMDAFGRTGFDGVWKQLKKDHGVSQREIIFASYTRNKTDIESAVKRYLSWLARAKGSDELARDGTFEAGIVLQAVRSPAAKLVKALIDELERVKSGGAVSSQYALDEDEIERLSKLKRVTFVGTALSEAFAAELLETGDPGKYCKDVLALQIVPDPASAGTLVLEYGEHMQAFDRNLVRDAYSLEGYIAARVFIAGLEAHGKDLTTESFVETLERMNQIDIGLGVPLGFSAQDHQASHTVWARKLTNACKFENFTELSF